MKASSDTSRQSPYAPRHMERRQVPTGTEVMRASGESSCAHRHGGQHHVATGNEVMRASGESSCPHRHGEQHQVATGTEVMSATCALLEVGHCPTATRARERER